MLTALQLHIIPLIISAFPPYCFLFVCFQYADWNGWMEHWEWTNQQIKRFSTNGLSVCRSVRVHRGAWFWFLSLALPQGFWLVGRCVGIRVSNEHWEPNLPSCHQETEINQFDDKRHWSSGHCLVSVLSQGRGITHQTEMECTADASRVEELGGAMSQFLMLPNFVFLFF